MKLSMRFHTSPAMQGRDRLGHYGPSGQDTMVTTPWTTEVSSSPPAHRRKRYGADGSPVPWTTIVVRRVRSVTSFYLVLGRSLLPLVYGRAVVVTHRLYSAARRRRTSRCQIVLFPDPVSSDSEGRSNDSDIILVHPYD